MAYALMTVKNWKQNGQADVADLCAQFKLAAADVDTNFGLIALGKDDYTVKIAEAQIDRLKQDYPGQFDGPFSDPSIGSFGSPSF